MLKRSHLSELLISRFTTQEKDKAARSISEESKLKMTGRLQIQRAISRFIAAISETVLLVLIEVKLM